MERIKANRQRINEDLHDPEKRKWFSPTMYAVHQTIVPAILKRARGNVIDVGCGDMPFKNVIVQVADRYDTIDVERRVPEVTFTSDIHDMKVLADGSYDTAICLEVIEHVPDPFRALRELARVVKPGGYLILSAPHLSRLHEEPHDYYRYTKYGLHRAITDAGFEVETIAPSGGLFSFLGHQVSTVLLGAVWHIPVVSRLSFFLNSWLCVRPCVALDDLLDKDKLFAMGYTVVARKRAAGGANGPALAGDSPA
jgi:SAM-dependent methyltransferase